MTNDASARLRRLRLPAEWEPQRAVLLSWPHAATDWAYMLDEVVDCFARLAMAIAGRALVLVVSPDPELPRQALAERKADLSRFVFVKADTNDTWTRDFGPITVVDEDGRLVANDFKFNGWGLKFPACHDNLINRALRGHELVGEYRNCLNFVLEGGSIDADGQGTILTTSECLLSPNRNGEYGRAEIERVLAETLGCERLVWLEHGALEGDDTDSHVDTLARFLPGGAIAYSACDRPDDAHYAELRAMETELQALGRELVALPIPRAIYDEDGQRLPATYANFLLLNGALLLPVYGDEEYDALAASRLRQALPGYEVVPIDCQALIRQHGSLHCVTMQLP